MKNDFLRPITNKAPKYREVAYKAIKDAILVGQIGPQQPLVEEQLAGLLNISRTPVREALAILEHEGLIAPRGIRGLYVRRLRRQEFIELFVANELIEPSLARRAAHLASEEQIRLLEENINRGQYFVGEGDFTSFLRSGREFHRLLGIAAENKPLTDFIVRNEECTDIYLIGTGKITSKETMQVSIREHTAILNAIIRRDPDEAARLVIVHAQSIRERFADLFSEGNSEEDEEPYRDLKGLEGVVNP